jgi:hypothetical protein
MQILMHRSYKAVVALAYLTAENASDSTLTARTTTFDLHLSIDLHTVFD